MRKHLYTLILLLISIGVSAQKLNFSNYSVENGLSGSNVHAILEDQFGRIWFGTENGGVTIFDGSEFEYLTIDNHLPTNDINDLMEDSKGNVWIATNEGVLKYDGESYELFNFEDGLSANLINVVFEDSKGNIWFGTEKARVCMYDGTDMKNFNSSKYFEAKTVRSIIETEEGVLLGTSAGLLLYDGHSFKEIEKFPGFGFGSVTSLLKTENRLWIGTVSGLNHIENGNVTDFSLLNPFPSNIITSLAEDGKGRIWVGTAGSGIIRIDEEENLFNITKENGIPSDYIFCLSVDYADNVYVGTLSGGAARYGGDAFTYYTEETNLKSNFVYAFLEDEEQNTWIGTGDGITIVKKDEFVQINRKDGLPDNQINALLESTDGLVWVGTYNGATIMENEKVIQNVGKAEGITTAVVSLYEDSKNNIWMGTYGQGVFKFDGEKLMNYSIKSGLSNDIIYSILETKDGEMLFGTYGGGLNILREDRISIVTTTDGLPSNIINHMAQDKWGQIWLATEKGLVLWDEGYPVFNTEAGLSHTAIEAIMADGNVLWLGGSKGVDKITLNPPQIRRIEDKLYSSIKRYNGENGLIGVEIKRGAIYKTDTGDVWFGTVKGAVQCNPRLSSEELKHYPKVYLKDIKIQYEDINWSDKEYSTTSFWDIPVDLDLPYNENHLTFSFVGIDMSSPTEIGYKWKLEGYDSDFSPLSKNRTATYPHLPPGDYTFVVYACISGENCSQEPVEYSFTIQSPVWKSPWFIALCLVALGLGSYVYINARERAFKRENERLEKTVKERTKEIVQKNEMMKVVNQEIIHKNEIIEQKNEEFNSSVRYAETIQRAFLPDPKDLKKWHPNSFIFYQPRDIVSGDFYWFKRIEGITVLSAVDCTGHGVPGALMSMIGMTLLNSIADGRKAATTGEALRLADIEIKKAFENSEVSNKDGMDLALVAIREEEQVIQYSGAQRPLFLIRDGKLMEFKGTKLSLGGYYDGIKSFEEHDILYKKGDVFYIFSDGYQDQFGGPKNKKFKVRQFKKLLLEIAPLPMDEQREILAKKFNDWKGVSEQTDDILVIGIKL